MRWKEQVPVAYAGGGGGGGAVVDAGGNAGGAVADVGGSADESAAGVYVAKYASALNGVAKSVGRLESM